MRRDEVRDLKWEEVDWRQGLLRLPDSKTGKRDVVVSDEVMALLGAIRDAKGDQFAVLPAGFDMLVAGALPVAVRMTGKIVLVP